jgi:hypothetical protein
MKVCFEYENITLEQRTNKLFRVTYGLQVGDDLTYSQACTNLGEALLHNAACEGRLENDGP